MLRRSCYLRRESLSVRTSLIGEDYSHDSAQPWGSSFQICERNQAVVLPDFCRWSHKGQVDSVSEDHGICFTDENDFGWASVVYQLIRYVIGMKFKYRVVRSNSSRQF